MTTEYTPNFGLALPDFRMGPWHDLVNNNMTKIDAMLYSALSGSDVANWAPSTLYTLGITVIDDSDATVWMCAVEHTSGVGTFAEDRIAHPTYWTRLLTGFAPRGQWTNSTNYFPYDLVYDEALGIMALCSLKHMSNETGNIKDDPLYWVYLIDMSNAELSTAIAVTYDDTGAPTLDADNVQEAIDQLAQQVVLLNNINITQGENITNLQGRVTTLEASVVALNNVNVTQGEELTSLRTDLNALTATVAAQGTADLKIAGNQTITGGFSVTPYNVSPIPAPFTPNPMVGNYQYLLNVGAFTINVPATDCAIDFLITNGAGAGVITFTGFVTGPNKGDALTITVNDRFFVSIRRINGLSTYVVKALQ